MIEQLLSRLRAWRERLGGTNEAKGRGPVPPNRVSTAVLKAQKHKQILRQVDEQMKQRKAEPVAEQPRIVSRGHNKNVYVVAPIETDENSLLREVDAAMPQAPTLQTLDEAGFDPYNSGVFRKTNVWRRP